jgi:hypothetical protein
VFNDYKTDIFLLLLRHLLPAVLLLNTLQVLLLMADILASYDTDEYLAGVTVHGCSPK